MIRLRFAFETATLGLLIALARALPRRLLRRIGAGLGAVAGALDWRHRAIAMDNLRRALGGEVGERELRTIERRCWRHFGSIFADTLAFSRYSPADLGRAVRYEGLEHLRRAYDQGRGVLIFSGHFGHWEFSALMQGYLGLPLALVTRPLDNRSLERMLARLRGRSGNTIIHKQDAVREMIRAVRRGIGVAILIDQDARGGLFVPFFGRPASTTPTLATLALRTGAAVIPAFSVPEPDGAFRVVYGPEVEVEDTGDRDADVRRITAECTAVLEYWVRKHPELWLWMHRRWKTRPEERGDGRGALN